MKAFELLRPQTLAGAVRLLASGDEARPPDQVKMIAGGQDLLGELKDHLVEPDALIDLKALPELSGLRRGQDGGLELGALVRLVEIERDAELARSHPMLVEAAASVASPQIRTLATVGGNLCQRPRCPYYRSEQALCLKKGGRECFSYGGYDKYNAILGGGPSYIVHPSDLAPALVAYDAQVHLAGPDGERSLPLERFFTLPSEGDVLRENVLGPAEIVVRVSIPARRGSSDGWRATYRKLRERESFDFALAAVALAVRMDGDAVAEARLVLGGVAPRPWRCASAEELLVGKEIDDEVAKAVAEEALRGARPLEQNGYKVPMAKGLVRKALRGLAG